MVTTIGQAASIAETVPSNWTLTDAVCVDGSNTVVSNGTWLSVSGATGTLTIPGTALAAGVNLTCTFTNTLLLPSLLVVKSADNASVKPGQVVTYMVLVTNTGSGNATAVTADDSLSSYTSLGLNSYGAGVVFQFSNGPPVSGLSLGTPIYSSDNGTTWTYTPVSGGGGAPAGYDGNVTNWKIPITGTMNANGANFTIRYQMRVK
jgi:uncharacterized repeat protein (TIGR01451 family)